MADIETLFFDIGGVLLTNGWDRHHRRHVIDEFGLDWEEFEDRHAFVAREFETGEITLQTYLERTVFYRTRPFSREEFVARIQAESQELPGTRQLIEQLRTVDRYLLCTLNNESRELNRYRIVRFRLRELFSAFFTSSFLGVTKPDPGMFHIALEITQTEAHKAVFVDDRPINVETAASLGMHTIQFRSPDHLRGELVALGVEAAPVPGARP
jgi:putative hydrolase of the HAD superfamily